MKKIKELLYILQNGCADIDPSEKEIVISNGEYQTRVEITNILDNHITIKFKVSAKAEIIETKSTVEELEDFIAHYYRSKTDMDNSRVIAAVGNDLYAKWIRDDLKILESADLAIDKEVPVGDKKVSCETQHSMSVYLTMEPTNLTNEPIEIMSFPIPLAPKYSIGCVKVTAAHFQPVGSQFYAQQIQIYIPVCKLDDYPIIKQFYTLNHTLNAEEAFNHLQEKSNNPALTQTLQYINLDHTLSTKTSNAKKNKI